MNFIGNDQGSAFRANFRYLLQFFRTPDPASRIVGIAQDEHAASAHGLPHMLEIHPVAPVFQYQRIVDDFPPVFADNHRKGMVNRGLNHDPVPQFGEALNGAGNTRNNAGGEPDLVRFHLPAVAAAHPAPDGLEKGGGFTV